MKSEFSLSKLFAMLLAVLILPVTLAAQTGEKGPEVDPSQDYYAVMVTSMGQLNLHLFAKEAPITVANFVNLAEGTREFTDPRSGQKAKRPYYNGTLFHRCIPEFMIQGGDPTGTGRGDPGYKFGDEFASGFKFDRPGLLAMANAGPGTNGSQFFVTEVPTPHLNNRHTIFGELVNTTEGLDTIKKMSRAPQNQSNKPLQAITLERVEIIRVPAGTPVAEVPFPKAGAAAKEAPKAEEKKEEAKKEEAPKTE